MDNCNTCKYFFRAKHYFNHECRRNAPETGLEPKYIQAYPNRRFPQVSEDDWCGEHCKSG